MLRLEFTKEEKSELDILTFEYQKITAALKKPKNILEALNMFKNNIPPLGEKEDLDTLEEILNKTAILRKNATKRALKYYSLNIDELVNDIKDYMQFSIQTTYFLLKENETLWRKNIIDSITDYLDLLKNISPDRYKEIEIFIEDIFKNKDKFVPQITIEEEKITKSAQKTENNQKNSNELGLYTANPLAIMFSGKPINALGQARTIGIIDPLRRKLDVNGVSIFLKRFKDITKLGVGEQKIFRYIIAAFTEKNSYNARNPQLRQRLFLSLSDYAKVTGTDISTEDRLKNFKKKLKKNLDNLKDDTTFSWTETIRGKEKSYANISFISGYKITKDTIVIEFSLSAAEYLVSLNTFIEYPRTLYLIDDRDYNTFAIGEAMNAHYSQYNNVIHGSEQILSVLKLLEITSFPDYESIKKERSWNERIKEPFEKALDHLYKCGFLKDWCYSKAKGIKLTDEEAGQITSYEKFISLYIWYELNEYPKHKERADNIIEIKIKNTKKASHSKRSRKKE